MQPLSAAGDVVQAVLSEQSPLIASVQKTVNEEFVPKWAKVAILVTSATMFTCWFTTGLAYAEQFNANPVIALGADLAAGALVRVTQKIIIPTRIDQKIYRYTTRYDHVIFQSLSMFQQAVKQTTDMRQVWFPAIFCHAGYIISGYIIFRLTGTQGGQFDFQTVIEERPLLEGNTWGSPDGVFASLKPFLVKSVALGVSGVAMAFIGYSKQSFTVWRLGWVASGIGLGMIPAQQATMLINRRGESVMRYLNSNLAPAAKRLLGIAGSLMPVLINMGICTAMAVTINAPSAGLRMDVVAAVANITSGVALSFLDVGAQDRFQHPRVHPGVVAIRPARCWENIKRRRGDYVCLGLTVAGEGVLLVSNLLYPS
ncbi:MAG: hypothetical protein LLG04_02770, partial [Parachlamydia sp.]|nr:hypothetical protein [Parachlamydia sp.]